MQSPAAVKDVGGRNWVRGMENRGRKEDVQCFSLKQKNYSLWFLFKNL